MVNEKPGKTQSLVGEVQKVIDAIQKTDLTPPYSYDSDSVNRLCEKPKAGKRWLTPYEIVQQLQMELEKYKESSGGASGGSEK